MLKVRLLGQFDVQLNGETVEIPSRPAQSLLAYLMLNAGTAHQRERLAGLLWPDSSETNARGNLRHALWRIRKAIGAHFILTDRVWATFDADAALWLDAAVLAAGVEPGDELSTDALIERISLYGGELLPGFYEDWVVRERERLHSVYEDRMRSLLERLLENERWREACEWAERWIAQGEVPEPAYRALMVAHGMLGDQAKVAAAYRRCVETLEQDLGVAPSEDTQDLYRRLSKGEKGPRRDTARAQREPRTNLPVPPTPFVGREALLAEIVERLENPACRLLTLVGPAGCGKTRLALEVAEGRLEDYQNGVFFVSLAPLESVEAIVPTVASALSFNFYEGPAPRQQLLDYLRAKHMLLIMDNFEHLLGGVDLVTEFLQAAPEVTVLATSRAKLNAAAEELFQVPGMDYPDADAVIVIDYGAVKLFVDRAERARRGFEPTAEDLVEVGRICALVDGMPLGIELAAAWVDALPVADIAVEIQGSLDFLETDVRDVPERQRSMRAVFDHSWKLLAQRERKVLAALSVFRGGFTRKAAQRVASATLRDLKGLVDKSLLYRSSARRYELHELLRQYAAEKLAESLDAVAAARDCHCAYYAGHLQRRGEELKGHRQLEAVVEIEADIENARSAWNWAVERRHIEWLDQAIDGLLMFHQWRGRHKEAEAICRMTAKSLEELESPDHKRILAMILAWQSGFSVVLGRIKAATQLLERSLSLLEAPDLCGQDNRAARASVLYRMAALAVTSGDYDEARRLQAKSLAVYRSLGDRWGEANALAGLGKVAFDLGDYDAAKHLGDQSLSIRQALGDRRGVTAALDFFGSIAFYQGGLKEAERIHRDVLAIREEMGDQIGVAQSLHGLGSALLWRGQFAEARMLVEKSLAIYDELGSRGSAAWENLILGVVEVMSGSYEHARIRLEKSLRIFQETGHRRAIGMARLWLGYIALVGKEHATAHRLMQQGADSLREIGHNEWSFAATALGYTARGLGKTGQAQGYLYEVLQSAAEIGTLNTIWSSIAIPAIALLYADRGEREAAVELYALASRDAVVAKSRLFDDIAGKHIAAVAATLPPDVVAAAQERGRARDLWATAQELLEELVKQLAK